MTRGALTIAGIVFIVAGVLAFSSIFTVHQTQQALVLQFGQPIRVVKQAGIEFKLPFIQNVVYFDKRALEYAPPAEEIIAADQKRIVVDTYAIFRITDPLLFFQSVGTETGVRARLSGIMSASLRRVVGNQTMGALLSEERTEIIREIRQVVNEAAVKFGIDVLDVRLRRADLPEANAQAIYARMQSEREREAREFRAQGAELAQRIRARADRERTVIIAESHRQSETLRGQGDSEAIATYANAYNRDPEFYGFYRSMKAYREALGDSDTSFVLSPDSEFFRYFGALPRPGQGSR
ncbi:MAG: protease modulator HflC [Alphaproteobacteria bacterium]|nr:protease modulator HflC [Alphaproteobacteria bacterium]